MLNTNYNDSCNLVAMLEERYFSVPFSFWRQWLWILQSLGLWHHVWSVIRNFWTAQ